MFAGRLEETGDFRRFALPDRLAPTEAERGGLQDRKAVIDAWLTPARTNVIKRSVGTVKGLMASASIGDDAIDRVLEGYALVLKPYSEAVIEDVCGRFLSGLIGNRVYAPTPAEIAHECRQAIADALAERGRIALILDAEVYSTPSPEEQAKIQAEYQRYTEETAAKSRMPEKPAPEPLRPRRDPGVASDLESRRARREAVEAETTTDADADAPDA